MDRNKRTALIIVVIILLALLTAFGALIGFITDYLWFKELSYTSVFFKQLFTQLKIGIPAFIVLTSLAYLYLRGIKRGYFKRLEITTETMSSKTLNVIAISLSAIAGFAITYLAVTRLWFEALKFYHSTSFDLKDPIFNMDVSFYVFKLQFIKEVNEIVIMGIIAFAVLTFIYYFLLLSVARPKVFGNKQDIPPRQEEDMSGQFTGGFGEESADENFDRAFGLGKIFQDFQKKMGGGAGNTGNAGAGGANFGGGGTGGSSGNSNLKELMYIASKQITAIGVIFFLMVGVNFFLRQYDLLYSESNILYGAGYTDIHVTLWMYRILIVLSILGAIMFAIGIGKKKYKTILTIPVIMIIVGALGVGGAALVQNLVVSPDEINKEKEYLSHNIEFTQNAYDLQNVVRKQFPANNKLTNKDIKNNSETINNIRINDYEPTKTFYNQTQAIRQYYQFNDVDVDRYMINGAYTQTFMSAREIDETKISEQWINRHIKYTHGYGVTLSRVDKITDNGQPDVLVKNIPPESQVKEIDVTRPEIYFGELTDNYILVNTDEKEFDYPEGDKNKYSMYEGKAGIKLNFFNRMLFAMKERSMKLMVSTNIDSDSKIIVNRNINDRVQKIMPYLNYSDPYIVTVNGKLYWMMDAYTTSTYYPYSEPYSGAGDTNYIRNSVKVVIDAYNGDTNYYLVDDSDPVANTLKSIYPKLFKDLNQMPEGLSEHIRYPSTMLNIQANVYKRYHVNDVNVFYQSEDLWEISNEKYGSDEEEVSMKPQYYIMKLPGEKKVEFINSIPYTPRDKKNMTGLLIARNDQPNYGELVLFQFPKSKIVMGPMQVEAQIEQHPTISQDFSLWKNSNTTVNRGNMFVIPIEDSIMYVEPIYLEATNSSLPEVKRVIVYYNNKVAYESTLPEALESMFGKGSSTETDDSTDTQDQTQDDQKTGVKDLSKLAGEAYDAAVAAQKKGDWKTYGEELEKLKGYLDQLNESTQK